jgi:hypothetical protein
MGVAAGPPGRLPSLKAAPDAPHARGAGRRPATESKRKRASGGTDRLARTRVRSRFRDAVPRGMPAGLTAVPQATAKLRTNR